MHYDRVYPGLPEYLHYCQSQSSGSGVVVSELSVVVVGAGIVGASVALSLQRDGHQVTLVDREAPCAGASFGNAGAIVNASCPPTAMPGIAFLGLTMLGRQLAPLSVRPAYAHKILPWLIRFVLESRRSRVEEIARNLHALTSRSIEGWRQLTDGTHLSRLLREGGSMKVYGSEASFAKTSDARRLMDANNVPYELLTAEAVRDLEPNLAPIFERGMIQHDSLYVSDPQRMNQGMVDLLVARGGSYRQFDARSLDFSDERIILRNMDEAISADNVIIAAGAWSEPLARQAGNRLPLDTERGYNIMLSARNNDLISRPVMNGDFSFVLTPMESGMRLCCQIEFAGLEAEPDYRHIRQLLPIAKKMLPGIDTEEESVWMGCRPSLPDSLPVLGFAKRNKNVIYAFGHQHLGVTLGPATGLIIADLVSGRNPGIDLAPYRPDRY
jgi:D-amino-acid dehydrogenase